MQVDRAVVHGRRRAAGVDGADQLAGGGVDHRHGVARGAAQRHGARRELVGPAQDVRAVRAPAQLPLADQDLGHVAPARPEHLGVGRLERRLVRGAQQVRGVELLVERVEDRCLHRALEELVRVAAEELVQRVLAGHVDREAAAAAARAAPHLAQRGHRARERHAHGGVERADVDPQLQRVRRHHAEQLAVDEPLLELAPLLRRVAGPVGRDPLGQLLVALVAQPQLGEAGDQLDRLARLHEHDRPRALHHQLGQQVGRLGQRGAARPCGLVGDRRVPHGHAALEPGRAVAVDHPHVVQPGQPLGQLGRVGDRRAGQQEARLTAVAETHAAQPAQHVGHVRAEHAAVHVRLVDHDDVEVGEEVRPGVVVGQDPDVQHVRVGEHDVRPPPDGRALLARGVAVVDRRPRPLDAQRVQRPRLVLGQRLRGVEVERAGARVAREPVQRRQVERQRLARRRPGGGDRRAGERRVERLGLVAPEEVDAAGAQPGGDVRVQFLRERHQLRLARVDHRLADQPLVRAAGLQQRVPGFDVADDDHGIRCYEPATAAAIACSQCARSGSNGAPASAVVT